MYIYSGHKRILLKYHHDNIGQCSHCKSINLSFAVYRDCVHVFDVPIFPSDEKEVEVLCLDCKEWDNRNPRAAHFKEITRTPIYLYGGPIVFIGLIAMVAIAKLLDDK